MHYPLCIILVSLTISSPSDADQRIDKFLRKYLPNAPLGGIFKWLRTGKVKVNGKKVEQNHRIEQGDVIDFYLSEVEIERMWDGSLPLLGGAGRGTPPNLPYKGRNISQSILYEDEYLLIVNKPAGINVHPGDHKSKEVSLIELVQDYLGKEYDTLSFRPSLVHRIDRDTSGCIMIAKEKKMLESLLSLLQNEGIEKVYHTIVIGTPEKRRDTICAKLLRIENARDEAKVRFDPDGQEAVTHYTVINANIRDKYSLLECQIETGRTHQIRVHMAYIGYPILGDKAYGDKGENSYAKRHLSIDRQMLHARSLSFFHPVTKTKITVEAPYFPDFLSLLHN